MAGCDTIKLESQLNTYYNYLRDVKKSSSNTFQAYQRDLAKFFDYLVSIQVLDFSDVDSEIISDFKNYLVSSGLSSPSVSRTLSSMRGLFQYFVIYL